MMKKTTWQGKEGMGGEKVRQEKKSHMRWWKKVTWKGRVGEKSGCKKNPYEMMKKSHLEGKGQRKIRTQKKNPYEMMGKNHLEGKGLRKIRRQEKTKTEKRTSVDLKWTVKAIHNDRTNVFVIIIVVVIGRRLVISRWLLTGLWFAIVQWLVIGRWLVIGHQSLQFTHGLFPDITQLMTSRCFL